MVGTYKRIHETDHKELNTSLYRHQRLIAEFIKTRRTVKLLHMLRSYSAFAVVFSSALLVTATNAASSKGSNGLISDYFRDPDADEAAIYAKANGQANKSNDLALVPLAKASTAIDPNFKEEDNQPIIQGQSMAMLSGAAIMKDPEEEGGVKMYIVQEGDTLGSIAGKNKVSINTILWANDIENVDEIMPGDTIFILPVSGVQHKVKSGDSIDAIAAKYKADRDKIIAFNELPANGDLKEGQTIVIPGGQGEQRPAPATAPTAPTPAGGLQKREYATSTGGTPEVSSGFKKLEGKAGTGHKFPYGYCTWYVAQKRYVPWGGNAGTWLYNAKAQGYATGKTPKVGSIVVTTENRYYGHVALVEKVSGDTITLSEMNYAGWGKTSRRTLSTKSRVIKGYIY